MINLAGGRKMSAFDFWILFEETGDIAYYLIYRQQESASERGAELSANAN
jgi:hypothetical protein